MDEKVLILFGIEVNPSGNEEVLSIGLLVTSLDTELSFVLIAVSVFDVDKIVLSLSSPDSTTHLFSSLL